MVRVLQRTFFWMCVGVCFGMTVVALFMPYRMRMTFSKCIAAMRDVIFYMSA
jgi:hypothetical protein